MASSSAPMDVDDDDPVVQEIEVFLQAPTEDDIMLWQYPLRPAWRPQDFSQLSEARLRPRQTKVELDFKVDTEGEHYDDGHPSEQKTATLTSNLIPPKHNYAVGVLQGGKLNLTPINSTIQLRPSFTFVDAEDNERKERQAAKEKAESSEVKSEPKALHVQFQRAETEKMIGMRKQSYAYLNKLQEEEPWTKLKVHKKDSAPCKQKLAQLQASTTGRIKFDTRPAKYLDNLSITRETRAPPPQPNQAAGVVEEVALKPLSKQRLNQMPAEEQLVAILRAAGVMPLDRISELTTRAKAKKDVLHLLQQKAMLVQGCWVLRSDLFCTSPLKAAERDYMLIQFLHDRWVQAKVLSTALGLDTAETRAMLSTVAKLRPGHGWEWKCPTDQQFIEAHPDVVKQSEALWQQRTAEMARILPPSARG